MTGQLFSSAATSPRLLSATRRASLAPEAQGGFEPDAHTHLQLRFDDGGPEVFLRDVRKFGKLLLLERGESHPRLARLGLDALETTGDALFAATRGRTASIKALLLDQALISGVGNIYADEALFRAGVRPARRAGRVTRRECERLAEAIRAVLERSIETGGSSIRDYFAPDGSDGFYQDERRVYARGGEPCRCLRSCDPALHRRTARYALLPEMPDLKRDSGAHVLTLCELRRASRLLDAALRGHRVQAIAQPDATCVVLTTYGAPAEGVEPRRHFLLLSCRPASARVSLLEAGRESLPAPPAFAQRSRSLLLASRVEGVRLLDEDRQLALALESRGERFELLLQILPQRSNLYLLDAERRVLAALRPLSETRPELALGEPWRAPASRRSVRGQGSLRRRARRALPVRDRVSFRRGRARRRARAAAPRDRARAAPGREGARAQAREDRRGARPGARRDAPRARRRAPEGSALARAAWRERGGGARSR